MKKHLIAPLCAVLLLLPIAINAVTSDGSRNYDDGGVVLRFSGPMGSVLNPGEEIGFSFQPQQNAYVVVFNIDTEGFVHLLHPVAGKYHTLTKAREWEHIPENPRERFVAEGETGIEFVFALTVPDKESIDQRELGFLADNERLPRENRYRIDGDPFLAANIIAGELVRGISHRQGIYLDYTYFYINERVDYPCYLCGECEGGQPDPLCDGYEIAANFDRGSPLTYPLRRAYELIDPASQPAEDYGVTYHDVDDDVETTRIHFTFDPYRNDVYYDVYDYDRDLDFHLYVWDPWWYDTWAWGWDYYPRYRHRGWFWYPYGHYYSWTFDWGYWCSGYYWSPWYYTRHHGYHNYYYYDYYRDYWRTHHYDRYKEKYKHKRERSPYKAKHTSSVATRSYTAQRDGRVKTASKDFRTSQRGKYNNVVRSKNTRVVKATKPATLRRHGSQVKYNKTTRVKNYRSRDTRTKYRNVDRNRDSKNTKRSFDGKSQRTRDTKVKSRSTSQERRSYKSNKSRSNSSKQRAVKSKKSSKQRSSKSSSVRKNKTTKKKSSKSTYKSAPRSKKSSSSKPAVRSSGRSSSKSSSKARSSGGSRSSSRSKSSGGKSKRK